MTEPNTATLMELAERVEKLTMPCFNVDMEIFKAIYPAEYEARLAALRSGPMGSRLGPADYDGYIQRPDYTASIDAAMKLVPAGATWSAGDWTNTGQTPQATCYPPWSVPRPWDYDGIVNAASPAISLTAAALRARVQVLKSAEDSTF